MFSFQEIACTEYSTIVHNEKGNPTLLRRCNRMLEIIEKCREANFSEVE